MNLSDQSNYLLHGDSPFIAPNWVPPKGVHAIMTTRLGGVSQAPYESMNLGSKSNDTLAALQENQRRLRVWLANKTNDETCYIEPVFLDQVHGINTVCLNNYVGNTSAKNILATNMPQADASYCTVQGVACVVRVADCMPVLLAVPGGVAAVHAGWRGLVNGVVESALHQLLNATEQAAHNVVAWLGPCIGPDAFEVGNDVRDAFLNRDKDNQCAFEPSEGKWLANLPLLGQLALNRFGVTQVYTDGRCTVREKGLFYSYRRDQKRLGDTGRMAACIWLDCP